MTEPGKEGFLRVGRGGSHDDEEETCEGLWVGKGGPGPYVDHFPISPFICRVRQSTVNLATIAPHGRVR